MIDDLNLFDRPAVLAVKRPIDRTVEQKLHPAHLLGDDVLVLAEIAL